MTKVTARETAGNGEYDCYGELEGFVVEAGEGLGEVLEGAYVSYEEEYGDYEGGDNALGVAFGGPEGAPGDGGDFIDESGFPGSDLGAFVDYRGHITILILTLVTLFRQGRGY